MSLTGSYDPKPLDLLSTPTRAARGAQAAANLAAFKATEVTVEDMLADDPELTEDDFEGECIARDREQDAEDAAEECPWCGTVGCTGSPCDYSSSFDAYSDEILDRRNLDY
jgi:hypothetical protein